MSYAVIPSAVRYVFGNGHQPGISTGVRISPQEQSREGVERFEDTLLVRAMLHRLPFVNQGHFRMRNNGWCTVYCLTLVFPSTRQAQAALDRIV
jgi:hypothetical protein